MPKWSSRYCGSKRRDGEPCGNPSGDGRGGPCGVHRRQAERLWVEQRAAKSRPARVVLPDGCIDGHSPDLVNCELGVDWP